MPQHGVIMRPAILSQSIVSFYVKILRVKRSTNIYALYGELGRYHMKTARQLIMINNLLKVKYRHLRQKTVLALFL